MKTKKPFMTMNGQEVVMVKPDEGVPAHLAIADYIMEKIRSNEIRPGEKMPSLNELSDHFRVNKHVVRLALSRLENLGLVTPMRGKGSFVKEQPRTVTFSLSQKNRYTPTLTQMGITTHSHLLEWCLDYPLPAEKERLALHDHDRVYRIEKLRYAGSRPFARGTSTLPENLVPGLERYLSDTHSSLVLLKHYGIESIKKYTVIEARMPLNRDAEWLQMPENMPIMQSTMLRVRSDGTPVEMEVSRVPADQIHYVAEYWNGDEGSIPEPDTE
jgi:DNA-binding GntR family transcriptional regulator